MKPQDSNIALLIHGDEPIFFLNQDELLEHIMDTQAHYDAHERSVPKDYVGALERANQGFEYYDRDWLEEQFSAKNNYAAERHNEECEARYGN